MQCRTPEAPSTGQASYSVRVHSLAVITAGERDPAAVVVALPHHPTGLDVVPGAMPGAHETALLVDAPAGEVTAEVTTPAAHSEQAAARVAHGIVACAHDRARGELGDRAHRQLVRHASPLRW